MTRAEAIEKLKSYDPMSMIPAIQMAIQALEETPKTGEWDMRYDDDAPQDGIWFCSVCGYYRFLDDISPQKFCPQCGARMLNGR